MAKKKATKTNGKHWIFVLCSSPDGPCFEPQLQPKLEPELLQSPNKDKPLLDVSPVEAGLKFISE